MRRSRLVVVMAAVMSSVLLAGCGDDEDGDDAGTSSSAPLTVGSDIAYPPVEFYKEGTKEVQGLDYDLCQAIAREMGRSGCEFANVTFDGLIPALQAKRFDVIFSAMSDSAERQKEIDFVDYFTVGTSIIVKKGNPAGIQSLDDLCGRTVGVQRGTTQEDVSNAQKEKCKAAGKDLEVLTFDTDVDAQQALRADRSVAGLNDFPVAAYVAEQAGDFEVVGEQIEAGPYGIGIRKDDVELRDMIKAALEAVIASGEYDSILAKWNVEKGALKTAAINGGS